MCRCGDNNAAAQKRPSVRCCNIDIFKCKTIYFKSNGKVSNQYSNREIHKRNKNPCNSFEVFMLEIIASAFATTVVDLRKMRKNHHKKVIKSALINPQATR